MKPQFIATKRIQKPDGKTYWEIGDEIEGAAQWPRIENWVRAGKVAILGASGRVHAIPVAVAASKARAEATESNAEETASASK